MSRRKGKTIFEREHGPIPEATVEEARELEEAERLGLNRSCLSDEPTDYMWMGGNEGESAVPKDIGQHTPLEEILLAVIDGHPKVSTAKRLQKKPERIYRLEQAMKYITGKEPSLGSVSLEITDVLERVARRWHSGYFGFADADSSLDQLLLEEIPGQANRKAHAEFRNNLLKPYRKAWKLHRHRFLARVAAQDLFDDCERRRMIGKTVQMLKHLGVPICVSNLSEETVPNRT